MYDKTIALSKEEIYNIAKYHMFKFPELRFNEFDGWRFEFNNRKKAVGLCDYRKQTIEISTNFIGMLNEYGIVMTILHEIAHALTYGHHHDHVWKRKCIEIGGNGNRLTGSDYYVNGIVGQTEICRKIAKYTYKCECCGYEVHYNRKPKFERFSCGKHNSKTFDDRYIMTLVS